MSFPGGARVFQGAVWIAGPASQGGTFLDDWEPVLQNAAAVVAYGPQDQELLWFWHWQHKQIHLCSLKPDSDRSCLEEVYFL